jgi:hypothetical protein
MLYREVIAVCSEINTKLINTEWQNVKFLNVKRGAIRNQWRLKGQLIRKKLKDSHYTYWGQRVLGS